jgi:REP element-mobilizing transposase RayT
MTYYQRHLPHWQPEGADLFLTWRLYGSLPRSVEIPPGQGAGKAFVAADRELDRAAFGPRWLADERVAEGIVAALHYGERQLGLYELQTWVVMVNHVHVLLHPHAPTAKITKAIKNFSARQANAILGRMGQFWQEESYDHWVRSREELEKIARYIEANPVAAGLVERAVDWRWSSVGQASRPVRDA